MGLLDKLFNSKKVAKEPEKGLLDMLFNSNKKAAQEHEMYLLLYELALIRNKISIRDKLSRETNDDIINCFARRQSRLIKRIHYHQEKHGVYPQNIPINNLFVRKSLSGLRPPPPPSPPPPRSLKPPKPPKDRYGNF